MQHLPETTDLDILAAQIVKRMSVFLSPLTATRWLSLKQAAQYSNWGQQKLISLATEKKIMGYQDETDGKKPWIFDRESIDSYRLELGSLDLSEDEQIAADIVKNLGL